MGDETSPGALVVSDDAIDRAALAARTTSAGLEVVAVAGNAVDAAGIAASRPPAVLVVEQELMGTPGLDLARELLASASPPVVVLVTTDPNLEPRATAAGVMAVVVHGDLAALDEALARARLAAADGEHRSGRDRRSGVDRRQVQDWSKVFSERRSGVDRRKGDRRVQGPDGDSGRGQTEDPAGS